jgi:hypothetical protein
MAHWCKTVTLDKPPAGFESVAEIREPKYGERYLGMAPGENLVCIAGRDFFPGEHRIVLTPIKPKDEPWTQKIAAEACHDRAWLRRKSSPISLFQIVIVDVTGVVLGNNTGVFYRDLMTNWEHCHAASPTDNTKWYPCTVKGWEDSSIPF